MPAWKALCVGFYCGVYVNNALTVDTNGITTLLS